MVIFGTILIYLGFFLMLCAFRVYFSVDKIQRRCCVETVGWRCSDMQYGYRVHENEYRGRFHGTCSSNWVTVRYNPEDYSDAYVKGDWKREQFSCQCLQLVSFVVTVTGLFCMVL